MNTQELQRTSCPKQRHPIRKGLCPFILCAGISLIALLAIPVCLLMIPIGLVWTLTDRILSILEE